MKKLTLFAAMAMLTLGVAGTAQAQHANNGGRNVFQQQRGADHRGSEIRGGERNPGVNRDFRNDRGRDYRGGDFRNDRGRDYRGEYGRDYRGYGYGRGGFDIYIGPGRFGYGYGYPNYNNVGATRIVYEVVQERVYDNYEGRWVYTGRTYQVSHVATWDNYYRGYVWYDSNGQLRVN